MKYIKKLKWRHMSRSHIFILLNIHNLVTILNFLMGLSTFLAFQSIGVLNFFFEDSQDLIRIFSVCLNK